MPELDAQTTTDAQNSAEVTNTNLNQPAEPAQQPAQTEAPKTVDLHGFTEEQLGDLAKFMKGQGGFEAFKARMSNPDKFKTQEPVKTEPVADQQTQQPQPQQPVQPTPVKTPEGYVSPQDLLVKSYFKELAKEEKYKNIAEDIEKGKIITEMTEMGMTPIDENRNINVAQLKRFLDLKAASVPTKPTPSEISTTPTVDYVQVDGEVKDMNQALAIIQQSMEAKKNGVPEHPNLAEAKKFLSEHWGKK